MVLKKLHKKYPEIIQSYYKNLKRVLEKNLEQNANSNNPLVG